MSEYKGKAVVFEEGYPVTCERCGYEFYADIAKLERAVAEATRLYVEINERGDVENEYLAHREAYDKMRDATLALNKYEAEMNLNSDDGHEEG